MSDAISRKWIKNAMLNYGFTAPDMTVTELVDDAPTIEPLKDKSLEQLMDECFNEGYRKAVRRGKWVVSGETTHYYICSVCGEAVMK